MTASTIRAETNVRWKILALATVTNAQVAAAPAMAMAVLFDEIATDLQLSLVQVGLVWGIGALPGLVAVLLGGLLYELQLLLGVEVDVVTEKGLRARIREQVLREAVPL